jgi:glutathione S-transferase
MILYTSPYSYTSRRCVATIKQLGLDVEQRVVDLGAGAHHAPEFAAMNPNRKVPVLVDGELVLWESVAIVNYLAEQRPGELLPATAVGRADALRWQTWTLSRFNAATGVFLFENLVKGFFNLGPPDAGRLAGTTPEVLACLDILEARLAGRAYLCGDHPTVADFTLYPTFEHAAVIGLPGVAERPALSAWVARMAALPGFQG